MTDEVARPFSEWWAPYDTVVEFWQQGRLEESARLIEQGARDHPAAAAMRITQARQISLEDGGRLEATRVAEALRHLQEAVEAEPANADVLLNAALIAYRLKQRDKTLNYVRALEPLHDALDSPVLEAALLHLLGQIARDGGEVEKAVGAMRIAVDLAPEAVEYATDLIQLLLKHGRIAEARDALRDAQARSPEDPALIEAATWFKRHVRLPSGFTFSPESN